MISLSYKAYPSSQCRRIGSYTARWSRLKVHVAQPQGSQEPREEQLQPLLGSEAEKMGQEANVIHPFNGTTSPEQLRDMSDDASSMVVRKPGATGIVLVAGISSLLQAANILRISLQNRVPERSKEPINWIFWTTFTILLLIPLLKR